MAEITCTDPETTGLTLLSPVTERTMASASAGFNDVLPPALARTPLVGVLSGETISRPKSRSQFMFS